MKFGRNSTTEKSDDFESEVDVNILGHIFEQSISDLETLKTKIPITSENQEILTSVTGEIIVSVQEELSIVEKQGRRKKEGIFYRPYRTVAVIGPHLGVERTPRISLFTFGTGNMPGKRPL
jgi:hypothetical protein